MTRAYLRLDPDFSQRKAGYPDGPYRALVDTLCAAESEPKRGHFRSLAVLRAILGRSARHLAYLFAHGDLQTLKDGRIYVVGWDEWQEGDWQVAERMRRVREARADRNDEPIEEVKSPGAVRTSNWRLRTKVFERDEYTCRYCGKADYERDWLIAEHVIPDGPTIEENLVTSCRPCNKRKGPRTPEQAGMVLLPAPRDASPTDAGDTSRAHGRDVTRPSSGGGGGKPLAVSGGTSGDGDATASETQTNGFDTELWVRVQRLGEELTGVGHALPNPYGGFGAQALSQAQSCSWPTFEAAYRKVAAVYGRPTARQLVFDAETILRPTGQAAQSTKPPSKEERDRAEGERQLAAIAARKAK